MPPGGAAVPNHLVWAILATVLCCLPSGIVAIVYSAQVNSKLLAGDIAGAQASSNSAKTWCWVSLGLGLATVAASIAMMMLGVIANINHH
jgi:Interferon-induced transmembrane protein